MSAQAEKTFSSLRPLSQTAWVSYAPPAARPYSASMASLPTGTSLTTSTSDQVSSLSMSQLSKLSNCTWAGSFALLFLLFYTLLYICLN
jgi:hypothetical protein